MPISLSVAWLGGGAGFLTAFISIVVRTVGDLASGSYQYPLTSFWNRFVDILVYFAIVWALHALISLQRRLEQRVAERTAALVSAARERSQLEEEILLAGARERNVFGQELHDDICQHLVGTALAAKVLTQHLQASDPAAAASAQAIVGLVEKGAEKTRKLARGLLLSAIEPDKLAENLAEFVGQSGTAALPCHFRTDGAVVVADASAAAQLFRIGQEALRNALRHANARRIEVALVGLPDAIVLTVDDDGQGLAGGAESPTGMGLRIMAHRAALIGATLTFTRKPDGGTQVRCVLPRQRPTP